MPKQDFAIVPLGPESLKSIVLAIGGTIPRSILHIQIEKGGQLQVVMYDQKWAAFFDTAVSENLKAKLLDQRVILRAGPTNRTGTS